MASGAAGNLGRAPHMTARDFCGGTRVQSPVEYERLGLAAYLSPRRPACYVVFSWRTCLEDAK